VYGAALVFLSLSWPWLHEAGGLMSFKAELEAAGGELNEWLRVATAATVMPPRRLEGMDAFPAADAEALVLLGSMLRSDPARRPRLAALLAHPSLQSAGETASPTRAYGDSNLRPPLLAYECPLPRRISARPLSLLLTLPLPLGAVLVEGVAPTICAIFRLGLRGAFLFVPGVHLALDSDQPRQNSASLQDFLAALEWRKATAGGWGAARKLAWRTW